MHYVGNALNVSVGTPTLVNSNYERLGITTHITPLKLNGFTTGAEERTMVYLVE